ncbi:hypothetical protein AWJ20_3170 [Sugiyamaella lignohabitans]|uniref:Defective in cullin neddylation protein n=1 Tax=Sugiyamaella lignohabitans TaxID=796027 RepID=A0A167FPI3_9ASCO|nr:uncharacterized protein AWJ20_3170 [Sugiyamaella lignohabitans]ANB15542.1 hypothetical protein AWJ20_3170 [Sugiyamaella lignohabitans]
MTAFETAVANWNLLLNGRFSELDKWSEFVLNKYKRNISKDVWNMTWEFAKYLKTDPELQEYSDEGAWPSVIDEFVAYLKNKQ